MEIVPSMALKISKILNLSYSLSFLFSFIIFVSVSFTIFLLWGIWLERKIIARMQSRYGPTYIGPFGLLVNIADFIKLLSKEDLIPEGADVKIFKYSPLILATIPFLILFLLPYSTNTFVISQDFSLVLPVALIALIPSVILLSGWSQNNKYSYIGAMRSAAQQLAYEIPLILSLVAIIIYTNTLNLVEIVEMQKNGWLIFKLPLLITFFILFISLLASIERIPFDLPFAENELVAGWKTEYSGIRYALTLELEYGLLLVALILLSAIFFGGWYGPFFKSEFWILFKSFLLAIIFFAVRASLPRYRIDQLLNISWKILIPLSIINLYLVILGV